MPDSYSPKTSRSFRPLWRSPIGALVLAGLSVALGIFGYNNVTALPTSSINFVIEDDLPYGITAEAVEHVWDSRDLKVWKPFTFHVTERELEWAETYRGETGEADILFSVGDDPADRDLVLEDYTRVAFQGEESGSENYRTATEIRAAFINNRTMGHGPSAVVGAAMTAADLKYPGSTRSPIWWIALAGLPLIGAFWVMNTWLKDRRVENGWQRRYRRARWQLAQVVLELDALQVRYETANSPELAPLWKDIRKSSLTLAKDEQNLEGTFLETEYVSAVDRTRHVAELEDYEEAVNALLHRADALAGSAEVRAGHVGSRTVLDKIAIPVVQAIDEIVARSKQFPDHAQQLIGQRERLLALTQQTAADETTDFEQLKKQHQQVLQQWREVEDLIRVIAKNLEKYIRQQKIGLISYRGTEAELTKAAQERLRHRIAATSAGLKQSLAQLRKAMGLGHGTQSGPSYPLERVLEVLDSQQLRGTAVSGQASAGSVTTPLKVGAVLGALGPILIGILAGWVAASSVDTTTSYGRVLTGDQHLQDLRIYGALELLPEIDDERRVAEGETNANTLTLEYIQDQMQRSLEYGISEALLPDSLDLTIAIVPIEEYVDYSFHQDFDNRLDIDYSDLLLAHQKLKKDVAQEHPDLVDPVTEEIVVGQSLAPIWVLSETTYAIGGILTGEVSWGIDSRLGTYFFKFTEPRVIGHEEYPLNVADVLIYELQQLGQNMEYNHQEKSHENPTAIFWMVGFMVWAALQTLIFIVVALVESSRRFQSTIASRKQLADLETQLEKLALGLDMSRLDMVAVMGGSSVSVTGGEVEVADQRLYESTLMTAWRQVEDLKTAPRTEQRGEQWQGRIQQVQTLVDIMKSRELSVSERAAAVLKDGDFGSP